MAKPNPARVIEQVPDASLLDEDDDNPETLDLHIPFDHTFEGTPRSGGKDIRINSPHPAAIPKTPPSTPPRQGASANTPPAHSASGKVHITSGRHYTKLGIYLHTDRRPTLTKMIFTQHICNPKFYTNINDLDKIVEKAKFLLMNHEPYHTLLQEGCSFDFIKPQLSYKVVALEENDLIDFVADLNRNGLPADQVNPIPFYEFTDGNHYTQTDVSFLFRVHKEKPARKPKMTDQSTATFDISVMTPIIDSVRNAASTIQAAQQTNSSQPPPSTSRPALSLANTAPPRHIIEPSAASPDRATRPRTQDRLGPPVLHDFRDRSRSHEDRYRPYDDRHRRGRDFRNRRK